MNLNQLVNAQINVQTIVIAAVAIGALFLVGKFILSVRGLFKSNKELKSKIAALELGTSPKTDNTVLTRLKDLETVSKNLSGALATAQNASTHAYNTANSLVPRVAEQEKRTIKSLELLGQVAKSMPATAPGLLKTIPAGIYATSSPAPAVAPAPMAAPVTAATIAAKTEQELAAAKEAQRKAKEDAYATAAQPVRTSMILAYLRKPSKFKYRSVSKIAAGLGLTSSSAVAMLTADLATLRNAKHVKYSKDNTKVCSAA